MIAKPTEVKERETKLLLQLRVGLKYARQIERNWQKGDLAEAVNMLRLWADDTEGMIGK